MKKLIVLMLVLGFVSGAMASPGFIVGNSNGDLWVNTAVDGLGSWSTLYTGAFTNVTGVTGLVDDDGGYALVNSAGQSWVSTDESASWALGGMPAGTYGTKNVISGMANGGLIVGTDGGGVYSYSDTSGTVAASWASAFTNVTGVAGIDTGGFAIVNSAGQGWVSSDASGSWSFLPGAGTYGAINHIDALDGAGYIIGSDTGNVWVYSDDSGTLAASWTGGQFGNVVGVAGLDGGGFAIVNAAGQAWVSNSIGDWTLTAAAGTYANASAIAGLDGGGFAIGTSTGNLWLYSDNAGTLANSWTGAFGAITSIDGTVPEPATVALLGLGSLVMLRRRKA